MLVAAAVTGETASVEVFVLELVLRRVLEAARDNCRQPEGETLRRREASERTTGQLQSLALPVVEEMAVRGAREQVAADPFFVRSPLRLQRAQSRPR